MKLSFRWYGPNDVITLDKISQIPNMQSIVTAPYDVKPGEAWNLSSLLEFKKEANSHGLAMDVIESVPVVEQIKHGSPDRDRYIASYAENIRLCAKAGVKVICYNFMPVFDWLRTDMHHLNEDGSNSLSYSYDDFKKINPNKLHLPGWDESYSEGELQGLLSIYRNITHERLFDNLVYFLKKIIPVCEENDISMAIHPDDPPWDVFSLPRIVSTEKDIDKLLSAVPSIRNGLTFCTGSLGSLKSNDLVKMAGKYARQGKIHFAHLRNIRYTDSEGSFVESGHFSRDGSLDMAAIVEALVSNGFDGYVRPDHGRNIWGEDQKPGYGLFDRALGATYINGLFEMVEKLKGEKK